MPTQVIAETECTLNLQTQEHVASTIHNGLYIVVLEHLLADCGSQAIYILLFNNNYFVITQPHTHTHAHTHTYNTSEFHGTVSFDPVEMFQQTINQNVYQTSGTQNLVII